MKTKSIFGSALLTIGIMLSMTSCEKDQTAKPGNVSLKFAAVTPGTALKTTPVSGVTIRNFMVNIDEIGFEFYDNPNDNFPDDESYTELELDGPFIVDLVKDGNNQLSTIVAGLTLPRTGFDEIEFDFERSENRNSVMFNRTILITGQVNGLPFEYFSNIDEFGVEIEFPRPVDLSQAAAASITVSVNMASIFDPTRGGVNLTQARDGNGNGIIEINHLDNDGNRALAAAIQAAILRSVNAIVEEEEEYED